MNQYRRKKALSVRVCAAELAADRVHPTHLSNGDEQKYRDEHGKPNYLMSFTKGLPHNSHNGLILNPNDFQQFVRAIDSGNPHDIEATPLGPPNGKYTGLKVQEVEKNTNKPVVPRAWESQSAGNTFDLEGPDAQAVTMPPAPELGSDELTAEMAEVYCQALLRDVAFTEFACDASGKPITHNNSDVDHLLGELNKLHWFKNQECCDLSPSSQSRKRNKLNRSNAFRGITPGDDIGPYISQFLLAGNTGLNGTDAEPLVEIDSSGKANIRIRTQQDGLIAYGAINIDQRVRVALEKDYMTTWKDWLDVQNGADVRSHEAYVSKNDVHNGALPRRFITTPRDLATYVHYDALYQAYLNACLILLGSGAKFDPGIPFQTPDEQDKQQGFAHFGGPHILSLVTEVATRALKAVRYQKFNIHRRLRPEALAARFEKRQAMPTPLFETIAKKPGMKQILQKLSQANGNVLLPMAFCEGSPMHPSYGAGHATVAGACVTILKAFFDHHAPLKLAGDEHTAFIPNSSGSKLKTVSVYNGTLTVEGELNKLASNISIGRDWAGVHYFSDYIESLRMGEQIAIGILEEQKLTYGENFSMTVPLYDGGSIRI